MLVCNYEIENEKKKKNPTLSSRPNGKVIKWEWANKGERIFLVPVHMWCLFHCLKIVANHSSLTDIILISVLKTGTLPQWRFLCLHSSKYECVKLN